MCRNSGVIGNLTFKDESLMKRLLLLGYLNSPHSTGLAAVRMNGDALVSKLALDPISLFDSTSFKTALNGHSSKVFIGHNRFATKGNVNNLNAHPYHYGNIVGAHNGTLNQSSWNAIEEALGEKFAVDSMAVIAGIDRLGIETLVPMMEGAWSLVWYDQSNGTINFLRNKERPMWYAWTKNFDHLFYASEWRMIDSALNMTPANQDYDVYVQEKDGKEASYFSTEVDVHYKFLVSDIIKGGTKTLATVQTLKGKEPEPAKTSSSGPFWQKVEGTGDGSGSGGTKSPTKTSQTDVHDNVIHMFGDLLRPLAGVVTRDKFYDMAKHGCGWCSADVSFEDAGVAVYERDGIVICPSCSGHQFNSRVHVQDMKAFV